jgi:hypothetical protein
MFSDRSRYKSVATNQFEFDDGRIVTYVRFRVGTRPGLLGYHKRLEEQRLDHLANFYLKDPTRFWLLCDANECPSPHALGARELIAIPTQER